MKLLTVLVNNRIDHVINFDAMKKYPNTYIAEIGAAQNVVLIDFSTNNNNCTCYKDSEDACLVIKHIYYKEGEGKKVGDFSVKDVLFTVVMEENIHGHLGRHVQSKPQVNPNTATTNEGEDVFNNGGYYNSGVLSIPKQVDTCFNVTIKFVVKNDEYSSEPEININVAPQSCIWDVVLDYGSESSQLLVLRRNQPLSVNNLNTLFDSFYNAHYSDSNGRGVEIKEERRREFVQYDSDSKYYYKSLFYIKKNFPINEDSTDKHFNLDITKPLGEDDDIKFLTLYRDIDEMRSQYMVVPNLKIANHGGVFLPQIQRGDVGATVFEIGDQDVYRKIVCAFMQIAVKKTMLGGNNPILLNIVLLVPNTYAQHEVTKVLTHLSDDVKSIQISKGRYAQGVEVSSISESDASFLGIKQQMSVNHDMRNQPGKYLILDAGKGTLDLSVIEDGAHGNNGHRFNSIFRSGIIGAGNAISYALLLAILNDLFWEITDEDQRKGKIEEFVQNYILNQDADIALVSNLMNKVEEYKRLYNDGSLGTQKVPTLSKNVQLDLNSLLNLLGNMINGKQALRNYSYVDTMIDNICYSVSNKIGGSYPTTDDYKVGYIIFAGRGFLMKKLRQRMEEVLKTRNASVCGDAEVKVYNVNDLMDPFSAVTHKNVCMFIINAIRSGLYNSRIVGIPFIKSLVKAKEDANEDVQTNKVIDAEIHEVGIIDKLKTLWKKISEKQNDSPVVRTVGELLGMATVQNIENKRLSAEKARSPRALASGWENKLIGDNAEMMVNGMVYNIHGAQTNEMIDVRILFDGEDFVVRKEAKGNNKRHTILEKTFNKGLQGGYVVESTFPFLLLPVGGQRLPFPTVTDWTASDHQSNVPSIDPKMQDSADEKELDKYKK